MSSGFSLFSSGAGKKKATRPELPIADVILSGNNLVAAGAGKSASPRVARSGSLEKLGSVQCPLVCSGTSHVLNGFAFVCRPEEAAIVAQAGRERCEIVPRPVFGGTWAGLGLSPWLCTTCSSLGLVTPTDVQNAVIPEVLRGKDVVACSQTGSGKVSGTHYSSSILPLEAPLVGASVGRT